MRDLNLRGALRFNKHFFLPFFLFSPSPFFDSRGHQNPHFQDSFYKNVGLSVFGSHCAISISKPLHVGCGDNGRFLKWAFVPSQKAVIFSKERGMYRTLTRGILWVLTR